MVTCGDAHVEVCNEGHRSPFHGWLANDADKWQFELAYVSSERARDYATPPRLFACRGSPDHLRIAREDTRTRFSEQDVLGADD
jgi:hypothetical protein